ncbi:hypothetical protein, partial [Escherichia coli]
PFPMPVEVQVGDRLVTLAMAGGSDTIDLPAGAHYVVDPWSKILKRSADIDAFQAWRAAQTSR